MTQRKKDVERIKTILLIFLLAFAIMFAGCSSSRYGCPANSGGTYYKYYFGKTNWSKSF